MLTADFCREPFSLNSGANFESVIITFDSRLVCDRESFALSLTYILLSPFPDAFNQLRKLFLAFDLGRRVDVVGSSFAVYRWCVSTLPTVRWELLDVSCAGLSLFALICFKFRFRRGFCTRLPTYSYIARRLYTADFAVDIACRRPSHFIGRMRIGVNGGCHRIVTEERGNRFYINAVLDCHRCEGMAQIVEAYARKPCFFQYPFQRTVCESRADRFFRFYKIREYPFRSAFLFSSF